jgi:dynein light intermediate chain 1
MLERERGWREEEFDFVLQFLRTILLKHGAGLVYTTPSSHSPLQPLIYSMLSIQTPHRSSHPLKHNVIERDKVFVPPHWDSWGKIRVLREGFDVEGINKGWNLDISHELADDAEPEGGAVEVYEDVIKDTSRNADSLALFKNGGMEVPPVDTQEFLAQQFEVLEAKAAEDKTSRDGKEASKKKRGDVDEGADKVLAEQVGPVQFNVGGIQVDAENMLESLKVPPTPATRKGSEANGNSNVKLAELLVEMRHRHRRPRACKRTGRARMRCCRRSLTPS